MTDINEDIAALAAEMRLALRVSEGIAALLDGATLHGTTEPLRAR